MALHLTPEEHDADPPESWTVHKSGRRWQLRSSSGAVLETFDTKTKAEAAKTSGFHASLYEKEGRWFKGEPVQGWKTYAQCLAERKANEARQIERRLEYLRGELRKECISYEELHELQTLAEHIEPGDVELLEAAGVPEAR